MWYLLSKGENHKKGALFTNSFAVVHNLYVLKSVRQNACLFRNTLSKIEGNKTP